MISAEHELPRSGSGDQFRDSVSIDFCDGDRELFGQAWITRLASGARARATVLVFAGTDAVERLDRESDASVQDWQRAEAGGVTMTTQSPLERWSLEVAGEVARVQLEVTAASAPVELAVAADQGGPAGISQYEQLCELSGVVSLRGKMHPVRCSGRRVHSWGDFAWNRFDRWRTLYAASATGRAITVAAARPAGSGGHDEEVRAASLVDERDAEPFEYVRISTVWDADGMPAKTGLELGMAGDELPRRLGGEAVCGTRTERDGHAIALSFFRWSMEGVPAWGCYETVQAT
jgi:hypothetical protein